MDGKDQYWSLLGRPHDNTHIHKAQYTEALKKRVNQAKYKLLVKRNVFSRADSQLLSKTFAIK